MQTFQGEKTHKKTQQNKPKWNKKKNQEKNLKASKLQAIVCAKEKKKKAFDYQW